MIDYFAVLGLTPSASDAEIKEAYRKLAKRYHPDSNPSNEAAAIRMQLINEAKGVLFDPVRREEHRVILGLSQKLTAERLAQFRNRPVSIPSFDANTARAKYQGWTTESKRAFTRVLIALVVAVTGLTTFMVIESSSKPTIPPIEQIIRRHSRTEARVQEEPIIEVKDDTLPALRKKAELLLMFGEYRAAAAYLHKCLEQDSTNEEVIRDLSFSYFKQGKYARSLQILSKQIHGDSNLVAAYYNVGEMFVAEGKPMDARNSFEEVLRVSARMPFRDPQTELFVDKARKRLGID